jgi:hypothetical protein
MAVVSQKDVLAMAQVERLDVSPEKLRNMGGLAIDQDIQGDVEMRSLRRMVFLTREIKGEAS